MSANSNETKLSVEGSPEAATEAIETASPAAHRRQALSLSLVGGMAAFLAACGKYVTRFDDQAGRKKVLDTGPGTKKSDRNVTGTTVVPPNGGGGPSTPGICINTSGAGAKTPAQILAVSSSGVPIYALYGNNFSALLAIKLKKSAGDGEVSVSVGDVVHILAKKSATESMLLASRRVRPADEYTNGFGLIFESLSLSAVATTAIEILIVKGGMKEGIHYKAELSKTFTNTFNNKPVYHLGELRQDEGLNDKARSAIAFDLGFGTMGGAPTLKGTSDIYDGSKKLGRINHNDRDYFAATSSSTWDVSNVVPSTAAVTNIFGETITLTNRTRSPLFREHQSLVVYVPKNKTVGGVIYDAYLRYFIYIG